MSNLCIYQGEFKDGLKVKGIEYFNNDDKYEGLFMNNKPDIRGNIKNERLNKEYEGEIYEN